MTRVRLLGDVAVLASRADTAEQAFQNTLDFIGENLQWPAGHMFVPGPDDQLIDSGIWTTHYQTAFKDLHAAIRQQPAHFTELAERVLNGLQPCWTDALAQNRGLAPYRRCGRFYIFAVCAFPILIDERIAGIAEFFICNPSRPDEELLDVLARVGDLLNLILTRKRAELKLLGLNRALDRQNEDLKNLTHALSHDLRSPLISLNGMIGELNIAFQQLKNTLNPALSTLEEPQRRILTELLEVDIPESLAIMAKSGAKMTEMVRNILKHARLGRRQLSTQTIDTYDLVTRLLSTLQYQLDKADIHVALGSLPSIKADAETLDLVFTNLLSNAIKYMPSERQPKLIRIWAEPNASETVFHIRDNGRGIVFEDLPKLFKLFSRVGEQDQPGEGVGLSFVQAALQNCGGTIQVASRSGQGSTFSFRIPSDFDIYLRQKTSLLSVENPLDSI